ncbi:MAG: hypothetical protein E5X48_17940 [Mesorhizobium sp.]|nr:MAG: hypothetical protein E5X48_17940 [Mesorhizobium sp.]
MAAENVRLFWSRKPLQNRTLWGLVEAPLSFVILWRSKERSDAAQTIGSMPLHRNFASGAEFCAVAPLGRGHGMDPWVFAPLRVATPKDDDVVEAPANAERLR